MNARLLKLHHRLRKLRAEPPRFVLLRRRHLRRVACAQVATFDGQELARGAADRAPETVHGRIVARFRHRQE